MSGIQRRARDERLARNVGFWWGVAEGLFFFIVPDVYVAFTGLFSIRAGLVAWLSSIGGSVTAVCAIYLLTATHGPNYLVFVEALPGISGALIRRVTETLAAQGLPYTPLLVFGGVPLKVYAGAAFSLGLPLGSVVLWTVFSRIVRIAPTLVVVATVRLLFRRWIDARPVVWCALLALFWLAFYVFYFVRMSRI